MQTLLENENFYANYLRVHILEMKCGRANALICVRDSIE